MRFLRIFTTACRVVMLRFFVPVAQKRLMWDVSGWDGGEGKRWERYCNNGTRRRTGYRLARRRGRRGLMTINPFVVIAAIVIECRNARHVGKGPRQGRRARPVDAWSGEIHNRPEFRWRTRKCRCRWRLQWKTSTYSNLENYPWVVDGSVSNAKDFTIFSISVAETRAEHRHKHTLSLFLTFFSLFSLWGAH